MQYKSVRSSSKSGFKNSVSLAAVSFGALLFAGSSWASLTVTPVRSSSDNTSLTNVDGTQTAYYPSVDPATVSTVVDTNDPVVPPNVPTATQVSNPSASDALVFNLTATTASYTAPSGSTLAYNAYVMAFVNSANGNGYYPVPIAAFNTAPGGGGTYQTCQGHCFLDGNQGPTPAGTTYYFAVPFAPNTTTQIAIYPSDLCYLYAGNQLINNAADAGQICNGASGDPATVYTRPTTGHIQGLQFKFYVVLIPANGITSINPQSSTSTDSSLSSAVDANHISITSDQASLNLSIQGQGGSIQAPCPDQNTVQIYFPGDQSIYLNTTLFQNKFSAPSLSGSSSGSGGIRVAPLNSLLMSFTTSTTPVAVSTTPTPFNTNTVLGRNTQLGNESQLVTGFTNTTQANPLYYNLGIYLRDYAGFVTATSGCPLNNVQAVEIQTFLKESKCFIATAAFRSMDAAPVAMLRQFRDQVLLHSSPGQAFVTWYYRWSPPAAEWLIDHPEFRYPVLLALVPVEIIAWLCLRPLIFVGLMSAGLLVLLALRKRANAHLRGESV